MKKIIVTLSIIVTASICWADPIQVSITGTANGNAFGYTSGQSYTFNWVINEAYTDGPALDSFEPTHNIWREESVSDSRVFSALSGDGITGTYTQPGNPVSFLQTGSPVSGQENKLSCNARTTSLLTENLGIYANGYSLISFSASSINIGAWAFPQTYTDPTAYMSSYTGTYSSIGGSIEMEHVNPVTGASYLSFSPTSATIEAIPEPATLAFVGIFGGGLWFIRRYFPSV